MSFLTDLTERRELLASSFGDPTSAAWSAAVSLADDDRTDTFEAAFDGTADPAGDSAGG